jgi:hypothetical protein
LVHLYRNLFVIDEQNLGIINHSLSVVQKCDIWFVMDGQKRQTLNHLLTALPPGLLVDSAWLQAQGVARTSVHDYVRRGWLERVAPRVYRRTTTQGAAALLRWDMAVMSAQRARSAISMSAA